MRVLIGALILGLCAWRTHTRAGDWRSDRALWTAATVTTPDAPRPWLNLTAADIQTGQYADAWTHWPRAIATSRAERYTAVRPTVWLYASRQLAWIDGMLQVCPASPFCAWVPSP